MEPFSNHQDPLYLLFQGKRHKITKAAESEQRGRPRPMASDPGHSKSSSKLQMAVKAFPTRLLNPGLPEPKCLMGTAAVDLTGIGIDRARTWQCYTCGFHNIYIYIYMIRYMIIYVCLMKNIQNSYTHTFIPSSYTRNPPKVRSWRGSLLQAIRAWFVFWYSWKVHMFIQTYLCLGFLCFGKPLPLPVSLQRP